MQAAAQALGRAVGGEPPDEYDRADAIGALAELWRDGVAAGPQFAVDGPRAVGGQLPDAVRGLPDARRWGGWVTTFAYRFDPRKPWFADQVVAAFREEFERVDAAGDFKAARVTIRLRLEEETGADMAPFPRTAALANARIAAERYGNPRNVATLTRGAITEADWRVVLQRIAQEDRYDAADGVEGAFGNRMSRIVLVVYEWRLPRGAGLADELGVPPRSVVDLPLPAGTALCGQACLAYALAAPGDQANFRKPDRPTAHNAAKRMARALKIEGAMDVADFEVFAEKHPAYTVTVMEGREDVLYRTRAGERYTTPIYLLLHGGHYYFIPKIEAFAKPSRQSRQSWCHGCAKLVGNRDLKHHACDGVCRRCRHYFVSDADRADHYAPTDEACLSCNFKHFYQGCRAHHRCVRWLCLSCENVYPLSRKQEHVCGEKYCRECDEYFVSFADGSEGNTHRCFILPKKAGRASDNVWAFDIESTLDQVEGEPEGVTRHNIALVVATKLYTRETRVFGADALSGEDAADEFLRWVEAQKAATLVAHNGSGYDNYLVLQEIKRRRIALPQTLIMDGQKVMYMKYQGVRFVDSMRHVAGSLEGLAKTFALPLAKGFFPYRFFTRSNLGYAGPPPDREWFDPDRMAPARRAELDAWLLEREADYWLGNDYNLLEECIKYCRLDVELLAGAMEKYRDAGLAATGVDPLQRATIASYAQDVYRCNFMIEKSLPILRRDEYDFVREGFYGGRTDARQVYRKWEDVLSDGEVVGGAAYVDVVSLYPTVQRYDRLPSGAPWWGISSGNEAIAGADACAEWLRELDSNDRVAMVECAVECPRDLYHPVLLTRRDGRLMATLDVERGVWPSNELLVALEQGYTVTAITRALCSETSVDLFAGYVDSYIALKQRHAPSGADPNVGMYLLAKMMLNSLWGKFGQRDQSSESRFYSGERGAESWYRTVGLFHQGALSALDVHELNADYLFCTSEKADGENLHLRTTDLLLAAFVTARARMRLYAELARLGDRVLYHDTDSVIYEVVPGAYSVPIGNRLGSWSDETALPSGPDPIVEFVGLGPKTYAYRTLSGATCVKSKGFSTGFTLSQYRSLAQGFLARLALERAGEVEPETRAERQKNGLTQESLHFRRVNTASGVGEMRTVPDFVKKLIVSLQKVHVVSATRTVPYGHWEA